MPKNKIMYATDYSEASSYAFQFATWLARCTHAKLLIVHVSQAEQYPIGELFNDMPEVDQQESDRLKSVRPNDPDIQYEHRLLYGEPGSTKARTPLMSFSRWRTRKTWTWLSLVRTGDLDWNDC
jgi:hypothetical protein